MCRSLCTVRLHQAEPFTGIYLLAKRSPPPFIREIPMNGFLDAGLECFLCPPPQFALELAGIDGVAPIVTGPILDIGYEAFMAFATRTQAIENAANSLHDINVPSFIA